MTAGAHRSVWRGPPNEAGCVAARVSCALAAGWCVLLTRAGQWRRWPNDQAFDVDVFE